MRKASLLTLAALFSAALAHAQNEGTAMADTMRSNGKIYVVVLVLATIFAGIIVYLIALDRRIRKLEKNEQP